MSASCRSRFPFTPSQWQELEHQALVYKYMVSGMPIPPDLLFTIRRSLDSSLSSKFLLQQNQHIGLSSFHMGFGRKIDPEPGRCRRTDGKKWRCSKEAYPDSKYCERHMHRGRNRSRKPVEILSPEITQNAIQINASIANKNTHSATSPLSYLTSTPSSSESNFLYPHFSSSRPPPGIGFSSQESTNSPTKFFLDTNSNGGSGGATDFRHGNSYEHGSDEHSFFSVSDSNSGTMRSMTGGGSAGEDFSWKLAPLAMGSPQMKRNAADSLDLGSGMFLSQKKHEQHNHYYTGDMMPFTTERDEQPKKVMHHFLDEWTPKDKDAWANTEEKSSANGTHLSMTISNSMHDFFMTQK